jgi:UDP-N-acetylglucosamine--dolichyl-phosphate N-acetylglucosaminephosphotransferase
MMLSPEIVITAILALIISVIITRILIPWVINSCINQGITTVDAHKQDNPIIAEAGGLAPLLGFIFTVLIIVFFWENIPWENVMPQTQPELFKPLLAGLLSVVIAGLIGFLDDVFKIRWRDKILLGFLPAIPLMALKVGTSTINLGFTVIDFGNLISLPYIGYINLYSLIIIPLMVNFAFNSFNMLAGFNGLEAGNGSISLAIILIAALFVGDPKITLFVTSLLGGFLVLLIYNWYPAKTLIGDTGTLALGTGIIVALIIGNMDRLAVGLFGLHFINFLLFFGYIYTHQAAKIATIDDNGNIVAPCPYTVYWLFPYFLKNIGERKNVILVLLLHTIISLIILLISLPAFTPV